MKIIILIIFLVLCYIFWQKQELKKFKVTNYSVTSAKLKAPVKLLLVSDYHCHPYGKGNERLIAAVKKERPDLILVPGDMIVSAYTDQYPVALAFFRELSKVAPVYFSNGNHESRVELPESQYYETYLAYRREVEKLGVRILNNQSEPVEVNGNILYLYGVDIPLSCYTKGKIVSLPEHYMEKVFAGKANKNEFTVLLAHNPMFSEDYAAWGADLIVSGHTHGGLIRIPYIGSIMSPQFELFPKYDAGQFQIGKSTAIVSRGLGTHTFHIRIFDRAELTVIHLQP